MIVLSPKEAAKLTGETREKYGRKKTEYRSVVYDSKAEAQFAAELDLKKCAGLIAGWDRQIVFPLVVDSTTLGYIVIDFSVWNERGEVEYFEVKGAETPLYKWKLKHLKAQYPDLKLTVIKRGKPRQS